MRLSFDAAGETRNSDQKLTQRGSETLVERKVRLIEKAESHFEKHRESWIANRYHALLKKDAPAPALTPPGASEDRTSRLMRAASHLVDRKQAGRIKAIERASLKGLARSAKDDLGR